MTTTVQPPTGVTRFYGNVNFALDVLANKLITFIHNSLLNDPFDPYFFFETDFAEKRQSLLKYVAQNHPNDLGWFKRSITAQSWSETVARIKQRTKYWKETTYVFSTTSHFNDLHPRQNLYMWGHYANGHRGVAIEFDTSALRKSVITYNNVVGKSEIVDNNVWSEIVYKSTLTPISSEDIFLFMKQEHDLATEKIPARAKTNLERHYDLMSTVKSDVWEREREWRLMWHSDETKMKIYRVPVSDDAITAVYLGLALSEFHAKDVIFETKRNFPKATLLAAKKRHGDLALDFLAVS